MLLSIALASVSAFAPDDPSQAPEPALSADTEQAAAGEPPAPEPLRMPTTVDEAIAVELPELERALEAADPAELQQLLDAWMVLVALQQEEFRAAAAADEGSELRRSASRLGTDRDALIARAEALIAAVADSGGSVEEARERIAAIRQAEAVELDRVSTVPADQSQAQGLPLEVLRAELRPLTKEQVEGQLQQWLDLLQKKCLEVRKVEVAALESEDAEEITRFNERAVELRGERGRLIERVRVVADALESKNGETADARAYLRSIVVAPPITGWRAAWATTLAWLTSPDGGIALARRAALTTAILLVSWVLSRLAARIVARAIRSLRRTSELLKEFLITTTRRGVLLLGILVAASQLGMNMGPLLAAIGAAGLVVGLALQGTLSNFASGLMIMVYRPFDVGDVISAAGTTGKVEGMTLVTTVVKTFDNQTIYIPNNRVWGDVITNVTANDTRRVDLTFGIGYEDDVERAGQVLMDVVRQHPQVLPTPEPTVRVHALGESSVDFVVRPWVRTENYWAVFWDLTQAVKQRFDAEGISIPFPQRDVHVYRSGDESGDWLQPAERPPSRAPSATAPAAER